MYGGNGGGGGGREFYPPDLGHQFNSVAACGGGGVRPPLPSPATLEHVVLLRQPAAPLSEESTLFDGLNATEMAGDVVAIIPYSEVQKLRNAQLPQLGGKYHREAR